MYTFQEGERALMRVKIRNVLAFAALLPLCVFLTQSSALAASSAPPAEGETAAQINEIATEIGDNFVRYPQLSGMANLTVQQAINDDIVNSAKIAQRLITLSTLKQSGASLQVSETTYLKNQLFSTVLSAKGMMENLRNAHSYTALSYDLNTGLRLQLSDFFTDPDAAAAWMEEQLSGYMDELSGYLDYAEITPLPVDSFSFDDGGITFYYPYRQFALLSGYSGAVQFQYGELQEFFIKDEGSVPARLGANLPQLTNEQIKANVEAITAQGSLPYLPVKLGDSLPDMIARYRLVRTPDQFPGGRYFQLEAPAFRQVLILSDALTQGYDSSVVEGILATRMNLYGIQTGVTERSRWLQILGEPAATVSLDASVAADYGLLPGTADYYTISGRQLMLYADENNILYAVRISK
jgi:hypothetical protein